MQGGSPVRESFLNANETIHCEFPLFAAILDGIGVIYQVHFRVGAFDQHVTLSRSLIFGVEKDAASNAL